MSESIEIMSEHTTEHESIEHTTEHESIEHTTEHESIEHVTEHESTEHTTEHESAEYATNQEISAIEKKNLMSEIIKKIVEELGNNFSDTENRESIMIAINNKLEKLNSLIKSLIGKGHDESFDEIIIENPNDIMSLDASTGMLFDKKIETSDEIMPEVVKIFLDLDVQYPFVKEFPNLAYSNSRLLTEFFEKCPHIEFSPELERDLMNEEEN
ncbi:28562_t:CDS:2 [Dentiscutata erythropus]|uniref:28562_t:CDS:1 n=1 Tax=Dentiscutata erythropus TaxID=1348616 RepID=A0A9N9IZD1_9GLOM|nr:28562_t:CDS:2 [Dentiscutata erythropus]